MHLERPFKCTDNVCGGMYFFISFQEWHFFSSGIPNYDYCKGTLTFKRVFKSNNFQVYVVILLWPRFRVYGHFTMYNRYLIIISNNLFKKL